jgi:uncharacterized lipoprotein YddW (UPF0748 family)
MAFLVFLLACSKSEDRAVWVVRFDLKTEKNVKKIVRNSKAAGFNMVIAQIYGRGDAYYNSRMVPRTEVLEDQPPDYDPLETIIKECRKKGLKVHAWVNAYYIWRGVSAEDPETYPKSEEHIVHAHPEWIIKDSTGKRLDEYDEEDRKLRWVEGLYADPSNDEYKEYFISVCKEIARKYDIDGLHLDFIRYPGSSFGYNDRAVTSFLYNYGVIPFDLSDTFASPIPEKFISRELSVTGRWEYYYHSLWIEHKSAYVTSLVRGLSEELKKINSADKTGREIALSAAVFPDRNSAYFSKSQDWGLWLKEDLLDMIMPMAYYGSKERVINQMYNVKKVAGDKKVLAGLGAYTKSDKDLKKEIHDLKKFNIDGFSFFSYGGMLPGADFSKEYTNIKSVRRKIFTPRVKISMEKKILKTPGGFNPLIYIPDVDDIKSSEADEELYDNLLSAAVKEGFAASQEEVEKFSDCLKKQFYSEDEFYVYLKRARIDDMNLKSMIARDITIFKYITKEIYPKVSIKDEETVTIPKSADYQLVYRYVHPRDSLEKRRNEKRTIDKIYAKLKKGGDFEELAKEYSRSATASNGGYYKNKFFDELDDVSNIIFSLKEGDMTDVITRPAGYGVYKLNKLEPETDKLYKDISNGVKKVIFYNKLKKAVTAAGERL